MDSRIEVLKSLLAQLRQVLIQRHENNRAYVRQVASFWPNFERKVQNIEKRDITIFWEDVAAEASQDLEELHRLKERWQGLNVGFRARAETLTNEIVQVRNALGWSIEQYNTWFEQTFPRRQPPEAWEWEILRVPD